MIARTWFLLVAFSLLLLTSAHPAVAATGTLTIGDGDGEVGVGMRRLIAPGSTENWFQDGHGCWTGSQAEPVGYFDYRFALEFPLDELPDDATVTGATLALRAVTPAVAEQTGIYGYAGDGAITAADMDVTGTPVLFTPTTSLRETHEVTALLTADVIAAGWAGFSLRQEPLRDDPRRVATWECPGTDFFPILTIEYSVPDPEPTATPTPSPTATPAPTVEPSPTAPTPTESPGAGMLPDTALGGTGGLVAWIAVLALASVVLLHWRLRVSRQ